MSIFITSDWHFCHTRDFLYEPRGFNNVDDMNEAIVEKYNSVICDEDDVYVLGDLMLNDNEKAIEYIEKLNGKIHVIRGNHDTNARIELYKKLDNIVEIEEAKHFRYKKFSLFLCHYPVLTSNYSDEKPLKSRMINICGHSHTKDKFLHFNDSVIYHAEVDAHDLYPVKLDTILEEIITEYKNRMTY